MDNKTLYDRLLKSQDNDVMLNDQDYEDIADDFFDEEKDDVVDIDSEIKGGDLFGGAMRRRRKRRVLTCYGRGLSGGMMYGGGSTGGGLSGGAPRKRKLAHPPKKGKCDKNFKLMKSVNGRRYCKSNGWQLVVKKNLKRVINEFKADGWEGRDAFAQAIKYLSGKYRAGLIKTNGSIIQ